MGKRLIIPGADFSVNAIENEPIIDPIPYTLQNGYASVATGGGSIDIDRMTSANSIRVRTGQLEGSYKVKTNTGYVIRAIVTYGSSIDITDPGYYYPNQPIQSIANVQGLTEYELTNENGYSIITFCKTDATQEISASADIVDYIIRPLE
jgi:hypothetical protein